MLSLIILDLDGTLYNLDDVLAGVYETQVAFLMKKWQQSEETVVAYLTDNHVYPYRSKDSRSATELFLKNGISKEEWSAWRNSHFNEKKINVEHAVDEHVVERLSKIAPIVLLSSNVREVIDRILGHIGISTRLFADICCSDSSNMTNPFNKLNAMQLILSKFDIPPSQMLSVGDRYKTDIEPALQIGSKGLLLKQPDYLLHVCEAIEEGHVETCQWFDYYE